MRPESFQFRAMNVVRRFFIARKASVSVVDAAFVDVDKARVRYAAGVPLNVVLFDHFGAELYDAMVREFEREIVAIKP